MKAAASSRVQSSSRQRLQVCSALRSSAWSPLSDVGSSSTKASARLSSTGRGSLLLQRRDSRPWSGSAPRYLGSPHQRVALQQRAPSRDVSAAATLTLLAQDVLCFLGSAVAVIPLFKRLRLSPVLGFLFCGVLLNQLGLTNDIEDLEKLSELGVLFLLFEMGLELSLDRLKALAKYAFGMGTLQVLLCTAAFSLAGLPVGQGLVTEFLEDVGHASHNLVSIRSVDEAVVIGGALAMSSSAFVLQLLQERGEMATRFGSATLGILLLQDIAVVPFLVLLPLIEQSSALEGASPVSLLKMLGPTALQTVAGLGVALVGGRVVLRRIFELVAQSRNAEAFLALTLLTVAGAAYSTSQLGFSDTMGAFLAGVLLSETNYKTQIEADVKPFRGLLLGLFFTTTGASIDMQVLTQKWEVIAWLLAGLVATKTIVIGTLGRAFGLTNNESIRIGLILSQGGEFAFVILSLASQLKVLPENLNQVLIIVVVLSMALTPGLAELGKVAGDWLDSMSPPVAAPQLIEADSSSIEESRLAEPIVICGFGPQSQLLVNMLENPLVPERPSYVVFDLDPVRVQTARGSGFPVIFGDGSRQVVLQAAGIKRPRAFVVCHRNSEQALHAVEALHASYPTVPVYACGTDLRHAAQLQEAGALTTVATSAEAGLSLGCRLLSAELGMTSTDISFLKQGVDDAMAMRTHMLSTMIAAGHELPSGSSDIIVLDTAQHHSTMSMEDLDMDDEELAAAVMGATQAVQEGQVLEGKASSSDVLTLSPPSSYANGASSTAATLQPTPSSSSPSASTSSGEEVNGNGAKPRNSGMMMAATATMFGSVDDSFEVATILQSPGTSCPLLPTAEMPSDSLQSYDEGDSKNDSEKPGQQRSSSPVLSSMREPS